MGSAQPGRVPVLDTRLELRRLTNAAPVGAACIRFRSGAQLYFCRYQPPIRSTAASELRALDRDQPTQDGRWRHVG